jgi:hypothetical protein
MDKIYTKCLKQSKALQPKQSTINFILNYSKALHIIKTREITVEVHKN